MTTTARTIQLNNAGFEALEQTTTPIPAAGFFDFVTPPGWSVYDPNNLIPTNGSLDTAFTGSWKPSAAFFAEIPEGDQIASIFLGRDSNGNSLAGRGKVGFAQTSNERIKPNTTYTLSTAILDTTGQDFNFFAGTPGYELQLVAGNQVLASTTNGQPLGDGQVQRDTVSFTTTTNGNTLGQKLGIRLINLNQNNGSNPIDGGNGIEVNFDDVQLTAAPARQAVFSLSLEEAQQPNPVPNTSATGDFDVTLLGNELRVEGTFSQLTSDLFFVGGADSVGNPESPVHIHIGEAGTNGPILRNLSVEDNGNGSGTISGQFTLSDAEVETARADGLYVNLHTLNNLSGELRGQIDLPPLTGEFGGDVVTPIEGSDRRDILRGDRTSNLIFGNGGNDYIFGRKGDDRLYGNAGRDLLSGGQGHDRLYGDDGRDILNGGQGNDLISGGQGNDKLRGGRGNDTLNGGDGHDKLFGSFGNDILNGGNGNDRLLGGREDDILNGGNGHDKIRGGHGNDTLAGGQGRDRLFGGRGKDTFVLSSGEGYDRIVDFTAGTDVIELTDDLVFGVGGNVYQSGNLLIHNQGDGNQEVLAHFHGLNDHLSASDFV